tara:strand:+ start:1034 stop:1150 length:117 start_codon:yes stop_codon:yes gene_type:complete
VLTGLDEKDFDGKGVWVRAERIKKITKYINNVENRMEK